MVLLFPKVKKMYLSFSLAEQISTPVNITCKKQDVISLHIFTLIGGIIMIIVFLEGTVTNLAI